MNGFTRLTYRREEVAGMLGVSARKIDTMIKSGELKAIKLGSSRTCTVLIPAEQVNELINKFKEE